MSDATALPSSPDPKLRLRWLAVAVFVGGVVVAGWQISRDQSPGLRHPATLSTAWASFALWAGAVGLMLQAKAGEWRPGGTRFAVAAWSWVLAAAMFVLHLGVAFQFAHRWSHTNAFRHVQETAGFGPGIFVSYLFTLVWVADVLWLLLAPAGYAARPRWVGSAVHGFLAFVTFNGTVVYVSGWIRWMALAVFVALGAAVVRQWLRRR